MIRERAALDVDHVPRDGDLLGRLLDAFAVARAAGRHDVDLDAVLLLAKGMGRAYGDRWTGGSKPAQSIP